MLRFRALLMGLMCLGLAAGCGAPKLPVASPAPVATQSPDSYPGPEVAFPTGYPGPGTGVPVFATPVLPSAPGEPPAPAAGKAAVSGVLFAPHTIGVIKGTII